MSSHWLAAVAAIMFATVVATAKAQTAAPADPAEAAFRAIYRELIETNTTLSSGSCTLAAERMAGRLRAAGFAERDIHLVPAPEKPREGSLVVVMPGTDPSAKAILLLAHIDVVEARREDWTRDPFTLVEEDGYFYGRGTTDDKAQATIWVDTLIRFRQEGFRPRRTVKLALTCGEETAGAFNGAEYLSTTHRDLIDAGFALNEGAGGRLDEKGTPVVLNIQVGEKLPENYRFEVTNPGGHSSRPVRENAIYRLGDALLKVREYQFPWESNEATRGYFAALGPITGGEVGAAMVAFAKNPADGRAASIIAAANPGWNALLHTTCVATTLDGGHATNALPQRARANVNCRIFPGTSIEAVREALVTVVADPQVAITADKARSPVSPPPPLTDAIMGPARAVAAEVFPGVPFVPVLTAGGTDGAFLNPAGIPTYGLSGIFGDPDGNGAHGLNERIRVKSLLDARRFLYTLVKRYAQ